MRWIVFAASLAALQGCGSKSGEVVSDRTPSKEIAFVRPAADPWVLTCSEPSLQEPALLWNGLIGLRLGRNGSGAASEAFFMIDEYEKTGEEKIRGLPSPVFIEVDEGSRELTAEGTMANYLQRLDMRDGKLTTEWDIDISTEANPGTQAHVKSESVCHPTLKMFATRWTITPTRDANVSIGAAPPESSKLIKTEGDLSLFEGLGASKVRWALRQDSVAPTGMNINVRKGEPLVFRASWSFGSGALATRSEAPKAPFDFEDVERASAEAWQKRWRTDIEIDGPVEDQQAVRSFLFYLRSAIHPGGDMSVSPFGLSNQMYNGHVFWDADIWVFPALALVDPTLATEIVDYRLRRQPQAEQNYLEWTKAKGPQTHLAKKTSWYYGPIKYPWESSVTGKETIPGPSRLQHHITGDVAFAAWQAEALGLFKPSASGALIGGADAFFIDRSVPGPSGREIKGTMSPDEHHTGDNDLYTNLLAEWLRRGSSWKGGEKTTYKLPKDDQTFLTYDEDQLRGYKQAAAVLSIYPLQYPPAEKQGRQMMERFAEKVIKSGPAMTDSVHATIWARLGEKDKAYETWQKSWVPFTENPLLLFSEKRTRSKTYFTTGAGGSLQSVLFGFLGFRIDWKKEPGAAWTTQLRGDAWLSLKPNLPSAWKSVKFKNFTVLGRRYTLTATPSAARVTPGE